MKAVQGAGLRAAPMLLVALALAVAVFARVVTFPFVTWDDPLYVTQNPLVTHPLSMGAVTLFRTPMVGYPQPLVILSFALEHALFGFEPSIFHLDNLILHVINVVLLFACARALGLRERPAAWAAILYAVHPLVVEPVCWVTGRKDLLAATLTLAAVNVVARDRGALSWRRWGAASAIAVLAIVAKPSALPVPALLAITAWYGEKRPPLVPLALRVAPGGVAAALLGALGVIGQKHVGALATRTRADVIPDIAGALALHLGHLAWPRNFAIAYSRLPGDPSTPAMVAASVAVIAVAALAWWRGSAIEKWGLAFALLAWLPASGIVPVMRYTADSYTYLPLAGIAIAIGAFASRVRDRAEPLANVAAIVIGIVLARAAVAQTWAWSSPEAVWITDTRRYYGDVYGLMELARVYENEGRAEEAAQTFERLDVEVPGFDDAYGERAAWLDKAGRHARAMQLRALCVARGDMRCVRDYWIALLREREPPPIDRRDTIARAFDLGFAPMKESLDEPAFFDRVAGILDAVHLDDRAAAARAWAVTLRARATPAP